MAAAVLLLLLLPMVLVAALVLEVTRMEADPCLPLAGLLPPLLLPDACTETDDVRSLERLPLLPVAVALAPLGTAADACLRGTGSCDAAGPANGLPLAASDRMLRWMLEDVAPEPVDTDTDTDDDDDDDGDEATEGDVDCGDPCAFALSFSCAMRWRAASTTFAFSFSMRACSSRRRRAVSSSRCTRTASRARRSSAVKAPLSPTRLPSP